MQIISRPMSQSDAAQIIQQIQRALNAKKETLTVGESFIGLKDLVHAQMYKNPHYDLVPRYNIYFTYKN